LGTFGVGLMLGLFSRRPPPDAGAVSRLKGWVADLMSLGDEDYVAVAELACREPGCAVLETIVTVALADRSRFVLRFPCDVAGVTEAEVRKLRSSLPQG
jgi:hypothetical protein